MVMRVHAQSGGVDGERTNTKPRAAQAAKVELVNVMERRPKRRRFFARIHPSIIMTRSRSDKRVNMNRRRRRCVGRRAHMRG